MEILQRLKSPVVIVQLIVIFGAVVVTLMPEFEGSVERIVQALAVIVNVIAGLNNPADRENF